MSENEAQRSQTDTGTDPPARSQYPTPGPGRLRAVLVIGSLFAIVWALASRVQTGQDPKVEKAGRIEVTARLLERPDQFPERGAYRYTFVLKYRVIKVHRQDPAGKYRLEPGDEIFVGHYKPWMRRAEIQDGDWGEEPLGGSLERFVTSEAHRLALDYELADLAPAGVLDYCYPPGVNRFFAVWTNPTSY